MPEQLLITVDGPTASGKSSLAYALAAATGMHVLDTGLTYRAVTYAALRGPVSPGTRLFETLRHDITPQATRPSRPLIVYHGEDITDAIWSPEIEEQLRTIAADPMWRRAIADHHHTIISRYDRMIVVGRDCAQSITEADQHVFLTATQTVRRERRRAQYRTLPGRTVSVGPATGLDHDTHAYVGRHPRGLVLETTYLPKRATARAVLHHLGDHR